MRVCIHVFILYLCLFFRFIPDDCDVFISPSPSVLVIEKFENDANTDIQVTGEVFYQNDTWQVKFKDCEDYDSGNCPYAAKLQWL